MDADVDPLVHVYAPPGDDVTEHLKRVERFNTREFKPVLCVDRAPSVGANAHEAALRMVEDHSGASVRTWRRFRTDE